jgi:hypothetical protein
VVSSGTPTGQPWVCPQCSTVMAPWVAEHRCPGEGGVSSPPAAIGINPYPTVWTATGGGTSSGSVHTVTSTTLGCGGNVSYLPGAEGVA